MTNSELAKTRALRVMRTIVRIRLARELLIVLAFTSLTAIMTWPYVTRLRDAVVDPGDPYLISWILWWDYHATFTNPLHLFDANLFYPLRYTLAFSEHSYGISVLFFPLYALGLRPLTVHAIALLFGFALSGYGAFRLGRTLTGSTVVASVAGIVFAFVPYRFHIMSQVAYLFSPWIPLVFEALILFARERSKRRAVWLGCAFFMNGITALTWFNFCLIPLALYSSFLECITSSGASMRSRPTQPGPSIGCRSKAAIVSGIAWETASPKVGSSNFFQVCCRYFFRWRRCQVLAVERARLHQPKSKSISSAC